MELSSSSVLFRSGSTDITRVRLELQTITTLTSQSVNYQTSLQEEVRNSLLTHDIKVSQSVSSINQRVDERIDRLKDMLREQSDRLRAQQDSQLSPSYRQGPPQSTTRSSSQRSTSSGGSVKDTRVDSIGIRVAQYASSCRKGCMCACHTQRRSYTPALLERVLGKLLIGYAGMPLVSPKCDSPECEEYRQRM